MRLVEWWVAKKYKQELDLWDRFRTRREAEKSLRTTYDDPKTFVLVRIITEVLKPEKSKSRT
jgi:hypothetical protein